MRWDRAYLGSMVNSSISSEVVFTALLEYILGVAASHGILRIFAKVEDDIPELELFQKAGFQRYARQLTYVFEPESVQGDFNPPSLRRWNRHHVWGLHQLY